MIHLRPFVLAALAIVLTLMFGCDDGQRLSPAGAPAAPGIDSLRNDPPDQMISQPSGPSTKSGTIPFLRHPLRTDLVEYPTAALPIWSAFREIRPTLVMLVNDPFLEPVPAPLREEVELLLRKGPPEQILERTRPANPDPLLQPTMAVSAALDSGLFSRVIWLLPTQAEKGGLSADTFRQQLLRFGAVTLEEADTLQLQEGKFVGTIRGVPWEAVPVNGFSRAEGPVVIHLDLGFVKPLYRNEIKTPLYPLLKQLFLQLRGAGMEALAVTVSLSQLTGEVPLDTRFLGRDLAALIQNPALLENALLPNWKRRGDALYLSNFFQKEKVQELYLAMEKADPQDASVQFQLYQSLRQREDGTGALERLARAVALDPVYALEYLVLSDLARQKGRSAEALRMYDLALDHLPKSPFLSLERARLLFSQGRGKEALEILDKLEKLPWSPVYHANLPDLIAQEKKAFRELPVSGALSEQVK